MKFLQVLQFLGLMAEKIMFWKKANEGPASNNTKEGAGHDQ